MTSRAGIPGLSVNNEAANRISFLDLDPDIRNEIYCLLLQASGAIIIDQERRSRHGEPNSLQKHGKLRPPPSQRGVPLLPQRAGLNPTILRLSRQVYLEAVSFLYAENRFSFQNPYKLRDAFLPVFGIRIRFVGYISIQCALIRSTKESTKCLTALRLAKHLRVLELNNILDKSVENVARKLMPFLKIFKAKWEGRGEFLNVLRLRRCFGPVDEWGELEPVSDEQTEKRNARFTETVRREAEKGWYSWGDMGEDPFWL